MLTQPVKIKERNMQNSYAHQNMKLWKGKRERSKKMSLKFAGTPEHENIPKQEQVTL